MNCRLVVIAYSSCIADGLRVGRPASICVDVYQGPDGARIPASWVLSRAAKVCLWHLADILFAELVCQLLTQSGHS